MNVNSVRKRIIEGGPVDRWLLAPVVALIAIGTVMVYSASFGVYRNSPLALLPTQILWVLIGSIALIVTSKIRYHYWRRFSVPMMVFVLVLLILVLVPYIGREIYGARRWLGIGSFQAQPSELAKLVFILYAADWLSQKGEKVRNLWYGLVPFGIMLGVVIGLVMLEPDMGTSLVIASIGMSMLFIAGAHLGQLAGGLGIAFGAFLALILTEGYRMRRLTIFLDPWSDPHNTGYQPIQGILALGSGGFMGEGLGMSRQKFDWLPVTYSDSIMAILGEELGFIGSVLVLVLVVVIAVRGYRTALRSNDAYGALIATGVTSWIVFQSCLNVSVITLTVPFTGVPMPFISYGGSSLTVLMAAVGLLLNVSRYARQEPEPKERASKESNGGRRWWPHRTRPADRLTKESV